MHEIVDDVSNAVIDAYLNLCSCADLIQDLEYWFSRSLDERGRLRIGDLGRGVI